MPTQVVAPTALLVASRSEQADVAVLLRGLGFHAVQVDGADAMNALREPLSLCLIDLHGDPADQIIVATARHENAVLVTRDDRMRGYAHVRSVW